MHWRGPAAHIVAIGTDNDFAFSPLPVGAEREQAKFIVNGVVKNQPRNSNETI